MAVSRGIEMEVCGSKLAVQGVNPIKFDLAWINLRKLKSLSVGLNCRKPAGHTPLEQCAHSLHPGCPKCSILCFHDFSAKRLLMSSGAKLLCHETAMLESQVCQVPHMETLRVNFFQDSPNGGGGSETPSTTSRSGQFFGSQD